ncbi:unnamed protein product, partial [Linum tenue]
VPLVVLLFLLFAPLPADLQDPTIFNFHFHLFLLHTGKIGVEDVSLGRLFPVDPGIGKCRGFTGQIRHRGADEPIEGIP